jgi:drug/metabolite transporter (DMT)-like permease
MSSQPQEVQPNDTARTRAAGYLLVLSTALLFGTAPTLAAIAFIGGTDTIGLQVVRFSITAAVITAAAVALRLPIRVPARELLLLLGLAATTSIASVGYMTAVRFVPVAVASLTFFVFPILVAVLLHLGRLESIRPLGGLGILASFLGLVLVLGDGLSGLDPAGVLMAFVAGSSVALSFLMTRALGGRVPALTMVLYSTGLPTLMLWLALPFLDPVALPETTAGWLGAIGNGLCYAGGLIGLYGAIARLGPLPVASAINLEPLVSVAAAFLLLGQALTPIQMLGAAVVVAGIAVVQRSRARRMPG